MAKRYKPSKASPPTDERPFDQSQKRFASMIRIAATSLAAAFVVVLTFGLFAPKWPLLQSSQQAVQPAAEFIGSETCSGCHQAQAASWSNSQHKHAMTTELPVPLAACAELVLSTHYERGRRG